ncbi:hypothetical protein E3O62_03055 [Cryobacterium sp. TMT2-15-1]|nr:hypothetical protein E3O62_03055 [Cryobacterium sp. TMT2-15-1]
MPTATEISKGAESTPVAASSGAAVIVSAAIGRAVSVGVGVGVGVGVSVGVCVGVTSARSAIVLSSVAHSTVEPPPLLE